MIILPQTSKNCITWLGLQYSRPSVTAGFVSMDSTNCALKIFEEKKQKNLRKFQMAKLKFATL